METPFSGAADAVGSAEIREFDAVNRERNCARAGGKSDRRGQPARIVQGGQSRARCRARSLSARGPGRRGSRPCSSLAIKSLRLSACGARSSGALRARPRAPSRARPAASAARRSARRCAVRSSPSEATSRFQPVALRRRSPCARAQVGEVGGQRFGLVAHFRQHRAEHHGGAHRLQRVLRAGPSGPAAGGGRCAAAPPAPRRSTARRPSSDGAASRSLSSSGFEPRLASPRSWLSTPRSARAVSIRA